MPLIHLSPALQGVLALWVFSVCINLEYASFRFIRQKQRWGVCLFSLLSLLISSLELQGICATILDVPQNAYLNWYSLLPGWLLLDITIILTGIALFLTHYAFYWQRTHISPVSVQVCLDSIPVGVCYYLPDGLPQLFNAEMEQLSFYATGEPIQNAASFWQCLQTGMVKNGCTMHETGDNPILCLPDGRVYSFSRKTVEMQFGFVYELTATDVTKEQEKSELLRGENEELEQINERLRRYGESVTEVTRERENLEANMRIHDKINWLLLSTRHCIEDGCTEEEKAALFSLWQKNVIVFCRTDTANASQNPVEDIRKAAASIGLRLEFQGALPQNKTHLHVVMLTAAECLTNAARHAKASTVMMTASDTEVVFTDDGECSADTIHEGGGLRAVRRAAEKVGGRMEVSTENGFSLKLLFPQGKEE